MKSSEEDSRVFCVLVLPHVAVKGNERRKQSLEHQHGGCSARSARPALLLGEPRPQIQRNVSDINCLILSTVCLTLFPPTGLVLQALIAWGQSEGDLSSL